MMTLPGSVRFGLMVVSPYRFLGRFDPSFDTSTVDEVERGRNQPKEIFFAFFFG